MAAGDGLSRWTDERLDDRTLAIDRTLQRLDEDIRVFAPAVGQMDVLEAEVNGLKEDVAEMRGEFKSIRESCRAAQAAAEKAAELSESAKKAVEAAVTAGIDAKAATEKARRDTLMAVAGFAAPVTVAIITGIVALLTQ